MSISTELTELHERNYLSLDRGVAIRSSLEEAGANPALYGTLEV
jgi:hypothetical protein